MVDNLDTNTLVFKTNLEKDIVLDYSELNQNKRNILFKLEELKFKYDEDNDCYLIDYSNVKLKKKLCKLVDENSYLVTRVKYEAYIFKPAIGETTLACITALDKKLIKLEFLGLIKGVVFTEKEAFTYTFEQPSTFNLDVFNATVSFGSKYTMKLEVGKMINVYLKEKIISSSNELFLICSLNSIDNQIR